MNKYDYKYSDNIYFHNIGIDHENGISIMGNWQLKTFNSILKKLKHEDRYIDYMKLDVEFSEWPALFEMLKTGSIHKIRQLAVEFHTPEMDIHTKPNNKCAWTKADTLKFMYRIILEIKNVGFSVFHSRTNYRTSFKSDITGRERYCCYDIHFVNTKHPLNQGSRRH